MAHGYEDERRIIWRQRLNYPGGLRLESVVDMLALRDAHIHRLEELVCELTTDRPTIKAKA